MNIVIEIGRVARKKELQRTKSDRPYVMFNLASHRGKDKDGQDLGTDFISCIVYDRQAENFDKYVGKGDLIAVVGRWNHYEYDKNDERRSNDNLVCDRVEYLITKKNKKESEPVESEEKEDTPFHPNVTSQEVNPNDIY